MHLAQAQTCHCRGSLLDEFLHNRAEVTDVTIVIVSVVVVFAATTKSKEELYSPELGVNVAKAQFVERHLGARI